MKLLGKKSPLVVLILMALSGAGVATAAPAAPQPLSLVTSAAVYEDTLGGAFVKAQKRVLDTRSATSVGGYSTPMSAGQWRSVQVAGDGLPSSGMSAVSVNLITLSPVASGYINASPGGAAGSIETSYHNYSAAGTESNEVVIEVGADGTIQFRASSTTHMIVDVQGYFTEGATAPGGFVVVPPSRRVDTRSGVGLPQAKLPSGSERIVHVAGSGVIPSDATAVSVNIAVTNQTGPGFFAATSSDEANSLARTYFRGGYAESFGATIPLAATGPTPGSFRVLVSGATIDLIVDVLGYYSPGVSGGGFTPLATRAIDTRAGTGVAIPAGATRKLQVAGVGEVPARGATAIQAQVTAVDPGTSGYLKMWADGAVEPSTSILNYRASSNTSNSTVSALSSAGGIQIKNSGTTAVDVIVDLHGWYASNGAEDQCEYRVSESGTNGVRVQRGTESALLPRTGPNAALPVFEGSLSGTALKVVAWRGTPESEIEEMLAEGDEDMAELAELSTQHASDGHVENSETITNVTPGAVDMADLETIAFRTEASGMVEYQAADTSSTVSSSASGSAESACVRTTDQETADITVSNGSSELYLSQGGETANSTESASGPRTYGWGTSVVRYRTFIPAKSVGSPCGTFAGDNRSFDSYFDRSNRTRASVFFTWEDADMDFTRRVAATKKLNGSGGVIEQRTASEKGIRFSSPVMAPTFGRVAITHSVGNPLCSLAGPISYNVVVEAWKSTTSYPIRSARISGKRVPVPYHEAYLYATSGERGHTILQRKSDRFICLSLPCGTDSFRASYPPN